MLHSISNIPSKELDLAWIVDAVTSTVMKRSRAVLRRKRDCTRSKRTERNAHVLTPVPASFETTEKEMQALNSEQERGLNGNL
jgi:hypothetical protein